MAELMENLPFVAALAKSLGGGGGGSGGVSDVKVNGTSVVEDGVANVPKAGDGTLGVVKGSDSSGVNISSDGTVGIIPATITLIKSGVVERRAITPVSQHMSSFYGLAKAAGDSTQSASLNAVGTYTETAKSKISDMLNAPETVSGSTPSITAKPGVRYICGEVSTIDITVPETGIIDVIFESGSTPAVLTITPPTGMTMKWAGGFDPASLEANTVYEINIMNGCLGVAGAWT
jgi:hypothetical protein